MAKNVVASSHPLATQAGLRMLAQGGNAVDAALACAIALTVVEPTNNGLGSDAFAILWDGRELHGLNASGRSPAAWSPDRFAGQGAMPERGFESVTVPGAVASWVEMSSRFGKLDFPALFEPAIDYADKGWLVPPIIAEQWRRAARILGHQPGFAEAFMPEGRTPQAGEVFRSKAQAETLRQIAETRGEAFYRGDLAGRVEAFAKEHGAAITAQDFADHTVDWCGTISKRFNDFDLHEIPPNGQGIAALMTMGILKSLGIEEHDPDSAESLHLQIEAMKLAFADLHTYVSDHRFMTETTIEHLLDDGYLASRAKLVDRARAQDFGAGSPKHCGTVCLAAADASGMMVSFIQSNYSGFGSGVVVPGTGISLQNRGFGFTLERGHPNEVAGAKRPFHTISPGFVMRGAEPAMAFCLMGGPIQAQGHVQMTLRTQVHGQDPQTAADAPRWRVNEGREVMVERAAGEDVLADLAARGHQVKAEAPETSFGFGGAQIVHRVEGGYVAGSDPRKDGQAAGF